MRVGVILLVVLSCGPDGRAREPGLVSGVDLPDPSTGAEPDAPRLDLPAWPDLPPGGQGSTGTGSTGADSSSTGDASTGAPDSSSGPGSTGDGPGSTGADASTSTVSTGDASTGQGPAPTGCPCAPDIDNFCDLAPGTCPPTAPGGYCDPDGDGSYLDGDFTAGWLDWKAECG